MPKKVVTITKPDGTKKVVILKENNKEPIKINNSGPIKTNSQPIKVRTLEESNRAKPPIPKAGLTKEREAYRYGGKKRK